MAEPEKLEITLKQPEETPSGNPGGYADVMRVLLENGSDINARDPWGRTALMIVAKAGDEDAFRLLLDWEADIHARDDRGFTALMYAAWQGHIEIVRALLERGADVNAKENKHGGTALLLAATGLEERTDRMADRPMDEAITEDDDPDD